MPSNNNVQTDMETDQQVVGFKLLTENDAEFNTDAINMGVNMFTSEFAKTQVQNCIDTMAEDDSFSIPQRMVLKNMAIAFFFSSIRNYFKHTYVCPN